MPELLVGYCRCSTDEQDLTARIDTLTRLGVDTQRIYVDHGLTGTNRDRPGLREALAAVREGDVPVVSKLDRLKRHVQDDGRPCIAATPTPQRGRRNTRRRR